MKRYALLIIISAIILPLGNQQVIAQENPKEEYTLGSTGSGYYNWANGRVWNSITTKQEKIYLLMGVEYGIFLTQREIYKGNPSDLIQPQVKEVVDSLTTSGFKTSELVSQVDSFYKDSSNNKIPVVDAYIYATKKMKGAKQNELDDFNAQLRGEYSK